MEKLSVLIVFYLIIGGLFFFMAVVRFIYRIFRNKGHFRKDVTDERDLQEITSIDRRIVVFAGQAMESGRNCVDIIKILALTKYESRKHPLKKARKDRVAIRARAATLACLRMGYGLSRRFVEKHPAARIVLARECFRESLRICLKCSKYTLENINSDRCPVYVYFTKNSMHKGAA